MARPAIEIVSDAKSKQYNPLKAWNLEMTIFKNKEQLFLLPTFGFVFGDGGLWFTIAFASYGISFRVYRFPGD